MIPILAASQPFFSAAPGEVSTTGFTGGQTATMTIIFTIVSWLFTNREWILSFFKKPVPTDTTVVPKQGIWDQITGLWGKIQNPEIIQMLKDTIMAFNAAMADKVFGYDDGLDLLGRIVELLKAARKAGREVAAKSPTVSG